MRKVYILSACRTAIGAFGGSLKEFGAAQLGAITMREAISRAGIAAENVDYVLAGNVLQAGQGQNPARQAQIAAGIPDAVPAMTLNKVCGSGLAAVNLAAAMIVAGQAECVLAGGMESMSRAPHVLDLRWGKKMGDAQMVDTMIRDGLTDAFYGYHMGITAENVANQYHISREEQDMFAVASQKKAASARAEGRFCDEIVTVEIPQKKGEQIVFCADEYIREGTTAEKLAKLAPAFSKDGTVTAGNASGINDGAAFMVVVSQAFLEQNGLSAMAAYVTGASVGVDPQIMGIGPVPTVKKALERAGLRMRDIDLVEANEAFAAQAIAVKRALEIEDEKLNVNGGAIALGHPIGASGARIAVTLLYEMQKRNATRGLATLCVGGGMGEAAIFERDSYCK